MSHRCRLCLVTILLLLMYLVGCARPANLVSITPAADSVVTVAPEFTLKFDTPMDLGSVRSSISLSPNAPLFDLQSSADGKTITLTFRASLEPETAYTLYLAETAKNQRGQSIRSSVSHRFRTAGARAPQVSFPRWSPNGQYLAWVEERGSRCELWVARSDGRERRQLAVDLVPRIRPEWHPASDRLVFAAYDIVGRTLYPAVYQVTLDRQVTRLVLNEALTDISTLRFAYSPDGAWLAVENGMWAADAHSDLARELGIARADGTEWRDFGNLLVGWGTDSGQLIYLDMPGIGESHRFDYDVWRYLVSQDRTQLVPEPGKIRNFGRADRSPDGRFFIFYDWEAVEVEGPQGLTMARLPIDLWMMTTDGTEVERLTQHSGRNGDPDIGPDGRVVYISDRAGDWDLWLMDPDGSNQVMLAGWAGSAETSPDWSPDGTWIAFVSDATGQPDLWLIRADGTGARLFVLESTVR